MFDNNNNLCRESIAEIVPTPHKLNLPNHAQVVLVPYIDTEIVDYQQYHTASPLLSSQCKAEKYFEKGIL
jgi:hypothetical protein